MVRLRVCVSGVGEGPSSVFVVKGVETNVVFPDCGIAGHYAVRLAL